MEGPNHLAAAAVHILVAVEARSRHLEVHIHCSTAALLNTLARDNQTSRLEDGSGQATLLRGRVEQTRRLQRPSAERDPAIGA